MAIFKWNRSGLRIECNRRGRKGRRGVNQEESMDLRSGARLDACVSVGDLTHISSTSLTPLRPLCPLRFHQKNNLLRPLRPLRLPLKNNPLHAEHGATILEAALAFPVLLLIILSLVDLSRLMLVRNVIEESMHRVSEYATTVPNLDINPQDYSAGDIEFKRYKKARELAIAAGTQFLEGVGYIDASGNSELNFYDFTRTFSDTANSPSSVTGKLMVLLPGECAQYGPDSEDQECNLAPLGASNDQIPTAPAAALMKNYPLRIVARANIETFTPFIPNFNLQVESYAYRQPIPQTPFNAEIEAELGNTDFSSDPPLPPPLLNPAEEEDEFVPTSCVANAQRLVDCSKDYNLPCKLLDQPGTGGFCEAIQIS